MQVYIPHSGSTKWFYLGDYGSFLIHGMSMRLPRRDGLLVQAQGEHDFGNADTAIDPALSEAAVARLASLFA